ncbi:MAG: dehypoxanthine futalosine cyclase [Nitrospirae bacterium]|nr:dehypoxanthine futalosine cyclase [Nitrospirota bacterium]
MSRISKNEALELFNTASTLELGKAADSVRASLHPDKTVTFIVDRNINYTNVCVNECSFCLFFKKLGDPAAYIISDEELFKKIEETIACEGTQILLQGGLHPDLDLSFFTGMLKKIKDGFKINIHGFSPPEIYDMAKKSGLSIKDTLSELKSAGLDSIPGGGAEILSDRVREAVSPKKIKSGQWLSVMREAHNLGMKTTATMMFGSVESGEDVVSHLDAVRALQDESKGFTAFIPWTFQPGDSALGQKSELATAVDYLRVLALSRLYLDNVKNIQVSWVTQGLKIAQTGLRFGANDFGSTMIEENVVRAAGVTYTVTKNDIINAVKSAGFSPAQRDTYYNVIKRF